MYTFRCKLMREKLIAHDMYHKELASIGYENLGYGTNEKCNGEDYSGTDGNAYFILLGKSNEYAKKYIYHKNSNSFTVEDSTCYIQGR